MTAISQSGRCTFTVPAGYVGFLQAKEPVQEGLTVVDFIPRSGENSVTLMLRCPKVGFMPCLALSMYSNQTYQCVQGIDGRKQALAHGTFAGQQFPAPQLEVNKPNRLVFSVTGDAIIGYINGDKICGGKTTVPLTSSSAAVQVAQAGESAERTRRSHRLLRLWVSLAPRARTKPRQEAAAPAAGRNSR